MSERFFIKTTPEVRKALAHLAIDLDASIEKLAGRLLAHALGVSGEDVRRGKLDIGDVAPSKPRKSK